MSESKYIIDIMFNFIDCTCKILLTNTPDMPIADETLLFSNVGNTSVRWYHEPKGDSLGDFNGVTELQVNENRKEYSFDTGDCLVKFEALAVYEHKKL